jgi:hypothetical protein
VRERRHLLLSDRRPCKFNALPRTEGRIALLRVQCKVTRHILLPPKNCPRQVENSLLHLTLNGTFRVVLMTFKLKTLFVILPVLFFLSPIWAAEFTYKEYTKASESWRRGFVFGISRYLSTVAQPDEEQPYPVRMAFQRCLGGSTDTLLARHVEAYAATNPGSSNGSMVAVVMRALFDLCRSEIEKTKLRPRP